MCCSIAKLQVTALFSEACRINLVEIRRWAGRKYLVAFYLSKRNGVKVSSPLKPSLLPRPCWQRHALRPQSTPRFIEKFQYTVPVVPHKAVSEVSKIGNLKERLVVVNHGWQSESTDGPVVGVVFFGMVAMVAVVTLPQLLDVVWCVV